MKVRTCKSVDMDVEVEIDTDDMIVEFSRQQDECNEDKNWRQLCIVMDAMTRIMANFSDEVIAKLPKPACDTLWERLDSEAVRYKMASQTKEPSAG